MPGARHVFDAFWELTTDRNNGWSAGQIPGAAIRAYAKDYGYEDIDEIDDFRILIRTMDSVFLEKTAPRNPNDKTASAALPPMSVRDIAAMHQKPK